jgi:hypothetical protein
MRPTNQCRRLVQKSYCTLTFPNVALHITPPHHTLAVHVFRPGELAAAKDQGACTRDFLLRVIDEVENRAATLVTLHRRQVAQSLRELVDSMDGK